MFFRTKMIKNTPLVQLVESYRNAEGQPRQRVVASLGDTKLPESEKKAIARSVEQHLRGTQELFPSDLSKEGAEWVRHIVQVTQKSKRVCLKQEGSVVDGVLIDKIETENVLQLGPQLVALKAWEELGLSNVLTSTGMSSSMQDIAQLMIANRLIEPLSEWALIDWSQRTALPEILNVRVTKTSKDRLYRASDQLLTHRKVVEKSLRQHEKDLFSLRRSIVLYDVTNMHFEGECKANPKAKHGKNKQKRNDCPQVALGVAYDENGFALAHEVFEGNMADTNTLTLILERLDLEDETLLPVVILDAGFASEKNISLLEEKGYNYLVNITRGSRKKYAGYFEKAEFKILPGRSDKKQVEVKTIIDPKNENRRLVLCRSKQRRLKETAMISTAEKRFMENAEALRKRIEKGQLKNHSVIERNIGSLKQKSPSVHRFYDLKHENQTLVITRLDDKIEEALSLCGDYVLKTNQSLNAENLWHLYMTLLKAEKGFRTLKGSLGVRPNYHQLEHRVDGHIFISILAYHLLTWIQYKLENAGDKREWKTIRRLLSTHSLVTTRLQLKEGRIISIRKPATPDAEQARVFNLLRIDWKKSCPTRITEIEA
jgi:transposase